MIPPRTSYLSALLAVCFSALAPPAGAAGLQLILSDGSRGGTLEAPSCEGFQFSWSAEVEVRGSVVQISSSDAAATVVGEGVLRFPAQPVELLFRGEAVEGADGVVLQAGIRNTGDEAVRLRLLTPLQGRFRPRGDPRAWRITALDKPIPEQPGRVWDLPGSNQTIRVSECGGLYRRDGQGVLVGPAGDPAAFVELRISGGADGEVMLRADALMDGVSVDPGETRWGQKVMILAEAPGPAIRRWVDEIAKTHGARTGGGALTGWSSWNFLAREVSGRDILALVAEAGRSPPSLRPRVVQLDDGYQDMEGNWNANAKFPEGLPFYAEKIAAVGARPGIWIAPLQVNANTEWAKDALNLEAVQGGRFDWPSANQPTGFGLLDPTHPRAREHVASCFRKLREQGLSYFKIHGDIDTTVWSNRKWTALEVMRDYFRTIRTAAGEDAYITAYGRMPNRALVGLVDACRPGDGVTRDQIRPAFDATLGALHLNGRWFAVDNDSIFMGTDIANVSRIEGGWPLVRTWLSLVGLSGGSAITSDPWYQEGFRDYRRNLEVLTPPAREAAEVLDLCRDREWSRLIRHVSRPWGRMTVALLWNPGSTERTVHLDFAAAGLDPAFRYAVWSFWDNRYLGVAEGGWTTPALAPGASQHVRFTPLAAVESRPVLVGSNLHIHCGAEEVRRVNSLQGAMEIELGGAGARDGDLFVYSRLRPELKAAEGCRAALSAAGEYVWRIRLEARDLAQAQRVELAFLVPVTRQTWFWVLCGLLLLALIAGAWRYAAWRRLRFENEVLQQRQELSAERARLAQDLHDDLGASLSQIGLMTEQVERALDSPGRARRELDRMYTVTRNIARQLDTMVWVVDPANDTLDKFINYLHGHATEYLALAGIRMDFTCPPDLPHTDLPAKIRHHLLMAAKEALHNVVQHSGAARVRLRIQLRGSDLVLELEDDGNGLPAGGASASGNGLSNMRKRMLELGGLFELRSPPGSGKGTLVRLTAPLGAVVQGPPA